MLPNGKRLENNKLKKMTLKSDSWLKVHEEVDGDRKLCYLNNVNPT